MTHSSQISQDLHFVRQAVDRKEGRRSPAAVFWVVAIYVLVCYPTLDFLPRWAGWFFGVGGIVMPIVLTFIGRRVARKEGEVDRRLLMRIRLHWFGGITLAVLFTMALAAIIPALRGPAGGQVLVVMIGLVYYTGGIHFDRQFLWLGLGLMAGGVAVSFAPPHFGWTALGVVFALGLVVPTFFKRRPDNDGQDSGLNTGSAHPLTA